MSNDMRVILNLFEEKTKNKICLLCRDGKDIRLFPWTWFNSLEIDKVAHKDSLILCDYDCNYLCICRVCWEGWQTASDNHLTQFINSKLSKD